MPLHKVLLVDDSPLDLQHLKMIVEAAGYEVFTAKDGKEAYEKAKNMRPDVILMDVVMEGMDGFEACRTITQDKDVGNIPVVFVTSKSQKADRVWGQLQGARQMISKPYSRQQILDAINAS